MALTDSGAILLAQLTRGSAVTPLNAANAYIGVGNSTTAFAASQTDLVGASKLRKGMDAGYPSGSSNVLTYQATFGTSEANFDWNEWGLTNSLTGGTLLGRRVEALGTKTSSQSWTFQTTATFSAT